MKIFCSFAFAIFIFLSHNCLAISPEQHLSDPEEQRARELFLQIKCPVCAGQVIESSETEIAAQLRKLVREKISAGESDEKIKEDLVQEYGDDILNSQPISGKNILLWVLPLAFVVGGVLIVRKT